MFSRHVATLLHPNPTPPTTHLVPPSHQPPASTSPQLLQSGTVGCGKSNCLMRHRAPAFTEQNNSNRFNGDILFLRGGGGALWQVLAYCADSHCRFVYLSF
ncbi:hypothetical protein E2C01_039623 [Portunus trituberculatus]|uniref:Uncharacterized protein n=1 Tax=Portunus trituberculatus TaxID=210409 RepID=A0A5B7FK97_PORTR|nr:hypothetical protein [Portunus trituberculatus]